MPFEKLDECPICKNKNFALFLNCKDYTTTNETFSLQKCTQCNFLATTPRPDETSIGAYYKSEKYISHTGASSSLIDSIYLVARNYTLRWKNRVVSRYNKKTNLLDYGCGTGEFLNVCAQAGWSTYGIEPSAEANQKAAGKNKTLVYKNIEDLPPVKFDVITLWHVLEHVGNLPETLTKLKNRLADNGTLFVAVPNPSSYDASVYKEYWAAYDVPRHLWHFTQKDIRSLMTMLNLSLIKVKPMPLDAFYISIMSNQYQTGKQNITGIISSIWIALNSNLKAKKSTEYSSLIYILKK